MQVHLICLSFVALMIGATLGGRLRYVAIPVDQAEWLESGPDDLGYSSDTQPLYRIPRGSSKSDQISRSSSMEEQESEQMIVREDGHGVPILNDNDNEEAARVERQSGGGHHEYVDYGAHTGHHGAFGWYADFPVHKHSR